MLQDEKKVSAELFQRNEPINVVRNELRSCTFAQVTLLWTFLLKTDHLWRVYWFFALFISFSFWFPAAFRVWQRAVGVQGSTARAGDLFPTQVRSHHSSHLTVFDPFMFPCWPCSWVSDVALISSTVTCVSFTVTFTAFHGCCCCALLSLYMHVLFVICWILVDVCFIITDILMVSNVSGPEKHCLNAELWLYI